MKLIQLAKKAFSIATLTSSMLLAGMNSAQSADRVKISFAGSFAPDHPVTQAQKSFKRDVEKATDGRVKVRVFPANQLR